VAESLSAPDPFYHVGFFASLFGVEVACLAVAILLLIAIVASPWLLGPYRFFRQFVARPAAQLLYRLRVLDSENIPPSGPALVCSNHVSRVDWMILMAAFARPLRFVVTMPWTRRFLLRRFLRWGRVLALDAASEPSFRSLAFEAAGEALRAGDVVAIFPESRMTLNGYLLTFDHSFEQIAERGNAPVVPVYVDGLWGTASSHSGGQARWKWPRWMRHPVRVAIGNAMPPATTAFQLRQAMQKLSADCAREHLKELLPVHRMFVRQAARHPFRSCFLDGMTGTELTYGRALAGAMILADRLRPLLGDAAMVGLWLPSAVGGALANIAVSFLGKTSVNLNYTASMESVRSAVAQCGIRHVLTSVQFLRNKPLDLGPDVQLTYLEDFRKHVTKVERIRAFLKVLLLPGFVLERWVLKLTGRGHRLDDLATIIFSSGSTGEPKGVMLSHGNIASNAKSMVQVVQLTQRDRLLAVLPFFHSFGYTVTLWVPLQVGASIVYHPDPRQAKKIGELSRVHRCTFFLSTPTFLRFYLRQCDKDDFRTLRLLFLGAEKVPRALAEEFERKFGILPLEGYGCTELSPVAVANVPDRESAGFTQIGHKPGSIGLPLPGVAAQVVDPDTGQPLGPEEEGMLLIYGPNVMKGYLNRPDLTAQVIRHGWYVTGDMAKIDQDGFITITGRLARFAKIGGEMVPLEKLEEEIHAALQTSERVCVLTCVPDEARGERLVVLHLPIDGRDPHFITDQLGERGVPNLWIPAERDFFLVPELPVLGSGKVDLQRLKQMALERYSRRQQGEPPAA
jgi:acyl-[acyl-carrier-protein]-phospholipid O-acyltransferase/long-chain-fatty-acid--[acyl-carrier-protein] ligase